MSSTLDPDNFPTDRPRPNLPPGHDTRSLGPSDSSDTGSDMAGPGLIDDDALALDRGTNEDDEAGRNDVANAGNSVGDPDMGDNSDRYGTGDRRTAGKEPSAGDGNDIRADRIIGADEAGLGRGLDQAEEAQLGIRDDDEADIERAYGGDVEADIAARRRGGGVEGTAEGDSGGRDTDVDRGV
jgi:hypothetical protein